MSPHQKSLQRGILLALFILVCFTINAQKISLVAGLPQDGIAATTANISNLEAIAVAPDGDLIVAMGPYQGYLRRVDAATGLITTIAGKGDGIPPAYSGPAVNSKVQSIAGIAVDSNGDIYFTENTWIRKITASTGVISTIAGDHTQQYSGDNGLAIDAKIYNPNNIIIKNGQLFFTDEAKVRKIDLSTGIISAVAGNGSTNYSGDGGLATDAGIFPIALAIDDANDLYIVDNFSKIRKVDHTTGIITHYAGSGSCCDSGDNGPATNAAFFAVRIAFDDGGLYLLGDNKVKRIDFSSGVITTVAGTGASTSTGDGGPAISATFAYMDFAIFNGDIFVGDRKNGNVRKISGGTISTVAGIGNFGGDGDAALYATLKAPRGLAVDSRNDLFIADTDNHRVRKIDHATGIISTIAGNGNSVASGDGGAALAAAIAFPKKLAVDASDNLYVANESTIRKINASTGNISTIAGTGVPGNTGNGGPAISAQIDLSIGDMAVVNNNLYFTSKEHHVVRKIDLATGTISVVAGTGGSSDSGDGDLATAASLGNPIDVAVNNNNDIFILNNPNVRRVDGVTGIISTIPLIFPNFNASIDIAPNGNFLVSGEFGITEYSPEGEMVDNQHTSEIPTSAWHLAYDRNGNFYFSDYLKNMIWKGVPRQSQTIQIAPIPVLKVGETYEINSSNVIASSGLTNFEFSFYSEEAAVFENNVIKAMKPGVAYFSVSHMGNADFRQAFAFQQVDIIKGDQTITFPRPADHVFGDAPFDLSATASSSLAITYSSESSKISLSEKTVTLLAPGLVSIQARQEGNSDYNAAPMVEQHFCINPAKPVMTASTDGKTLTSSATQGNVWFKDGVAIEGATASTLQALIPGTYTVMVNVDGCQSFISDQYVVKKDQQITFSNPGDRVLGDAPFELSAASNSALTVSFSTTSSKISLSSKTVTLVAAGRASILAEQEGNAAFNAAAAVEQSFCINPAKPVITPSTDGNTLTASGTGGHQWYLDGVAIEGATSPTLQVSTTGNYTVNITVDDCESVRSDAHKIDVITSLALVDPEFAVSVYPSPASHEITLKVARPGETSVTFINSLGRKVFTWNGTVEQTIQLPVRHLPSSTYVIHVTQGRKSMQVRFVKH